MKYSELERQRADFIAARNSGCGDLRSMPYTGFYPVDIFNCEEFVMFNGDDDPRCFDILYERNFEPTSVHVAQKLLAVSKYFIDIGAHVGVYSLVAAMTNRDIPIVSFEPNPLAFARLILHLKLNKLTDRVKVFLVALGESNGLREFVWLKKGFGWISSGGSLVPEGLRATDERLEHYFAISRTMDSLDLQFEGHGLLKIDVEGGELDVFRGMTNFLKRRPSIILECFKHDACDAITSMTKPLGYRYFKIDEKTANLTPTPTLEPADPKSGSFNQLLTTKETDELISLFKVD